MEHIRAQLVVAEDQIHAIQEAWEKYEENLARILDQVYQDCHHYHRGPRCRYVARKRLFTYPWGDKVKKTGYALRGTNRVPPPPQPEYEEEEDPEIRVYYDSDGIPSLLESTTPHSDLQTSRTMLKPT